MSKYLESQKAKSFRQMHGLSNYCNHDQALLVLLSSQVTQKGYGKNFRPTQGVHWSTKVKLNANPWGRRQLDKDLLTVGRPIQYSVDG